MIRREVTLPADAGTVWEALTSPAALETWFGATVDWELRPGGRARFGGEGGEREGTVEEVEPGRALRFVWWPSGDDAERSEVAYVLAPEGDATTLTVTERRVGAEPAPDDTSPADGAAALDTTVDLAAGAPRWTAVDDVALRAWACGPVASCLVH